MASRMVKETVFRIQSFLLFVRFGILERRIRASAGIAAS
jgi:hypothetical protein